MASITGGTIGIHTLRPKEISRRNADAAEGLERGIPFDDAPMRVAACRTFARVGSNTLMVRSGGLATPFLQGGVGG